MSILTQFIFRLSFGLALGMALTNPRQVTSGFYRNHLYVLLGLNVLATMISLAAPETFPLAPPLAAAILSYVGAVFWLYEKPRPGLATCATIAGLALWGACATWHVDSQLRTLPAILAWLDPPTSGLVLGLMIAAMFLGHWYLNSPTMVLGPLNRLVMLVGGAIVLRAIVEGAILALVVASSGVPTTDQLLFLALRWLSGIVGAAVVVVMAHQTLKIPNTQSATGILYVGVIVTFVGELTALLLHERLQHAMAMGVS